jgi:DNA-binding transcriptional LysR family regulator
MHWRDTWYLGDHRVAVRPRLLTHSTESLRAAALARIGLLVAPDWMVTAALAAGIYAGYPTNRLVTPRGPVFVDHRVRDLRSRRITR